LARHDRTRRRLDRGYKTLARYLRPLRRVEAAAALEQPPASPGGAAGHRLDHRSSEEPQTGRLSAAMKNCP
jgi:hypothetical protein